MGAPEERPRVHFLYDGCRFATSDPKYRLDAWCGCHEHFGTDIAAAVMHIGEADNSYGTAASRLNLAMAKQVTGARQWVAQTQHVIEWLLSNLDAAGVDLQAQLEIVASFLQRAAWVLHDPDADETRANEPQPHTPTYTQYCLACGKDHLEASVERLNQEGEGR